MFSKVKEIKGAELGPHRFPEYPPRDDMQNPIHLYKPGYLYALHRQFGLADTTLVHSEVPLGHTTRQRAGVLIPDLMIAFDVDVATIIEQWGFAIDVQGKAPEFVLEVASPNTSRNDEAGKRSGYQAYGVQEYWRFDPTGGRLYRQGLAGDALVDGEYRPVTIESDGADSWGYSEALGLALCWVDGNLRWWDPASGEYVMNQYELAEELAVEQEARQSAEARVRELEAELERRNRSEETR